MTRQRKTFKTSLKLEFVRMIKEQGLSVQNASESPTAKGAPVPHSCRVLSVSRSGY